MTNSFGKTVNNIASVCSMQKCKVSQEEALCSAKYTRNGGGKIKLFSVSQGHNLDCNTLGVLLGDVHAHPGTQSCHREKVTGEPRGSYSAGYRCLHSPVTGKQPALTLQRCPWAN